LGKEFGGGRTLAPGGLGIQFSCWIFSLQGYQNGHELCPEDVAQALRVMYTHLGSERELRLAPASAPAYGFYPTDMAVDRESHHPTHVCVRSAWCGGHRILIPRLGTGP